MYKSTVNYPQADYNNWQIYDSKRGNEYLSANTTDAEKNDFIEFTDTGFKPGFGAGTGPYKYIYVAIAEDAEADLPMPTGILTEDADASGPSMTLTDVTGIWTEGLTAVNETEVTEHAPCGDDIQFLSSKPETVTGTVTAWGAAEWKLTNTDYQRCPDRHSPAAEH